MRLFFDLNTFSGVWTLLDEFNLPLDTTKQLDLDEDITSTFTSESISIASSQ